MASLTTTGLFVFSLLCLKFPFFFKDITETKSLIQHLPTIIPTIYLLLFRETCQAAYRDIVQPETPETEDKRNYSVRWLEFGDILRFF